MAAPCITIKQSKSEHARGIRVEYHSDESSGIGSIIFFRYYYYYLFDRPAALAYAGGRRRTIRISIDMWARGATSDGKKTRAQTISFSKKKKKNQIDLTATDRKKIVFSPYTTTHNNFCRITNETNRYDNITDGDDGRE